MEWAERSNSLGLFSYRTFPYGPSNEIRLLLFFGWVTANEKGGGPGRDRTAGLLVANEALSQLSYRPIKTS